MPDNLNSPDQKTDSFCRNEKGFTMLELIISMVIFLIVTGSIYGVLQIAQRSRLTVNQQVQLSKSVRIGLNLVGRDTFNAGYVYPLKNTVKLPDNKISTLLAIPNDVGTTDDTVPPVIVGNNTQINTYNTVAGVNTDQVTFLFKDSTFNLVGPVGMPNDEKISQPLTINAATTTSGVDEIKIVSTSGTNAVCNVNDIFLITGTSGSTLGVATGKSGTDTIRFADGFANGDVLGFNKPGTGGLLRAITFPASIQKVKIVTYFVTADGILTRREYANVPPTTPLQAFVDEPLVFGVENFQIKYVLDDGTLSDNPSAGPNGIAGDADDTQSRLSEVRQIRYTVSARTVELNSVGQPYRETMTSTFSTRNLGYDAD